MFQYAYSVRKTLFASKFSFHHCSNRKTQSSSISSYPRPHRRSAMGCQPWSPPRAPPNALHAPHCTVFTDHYKSLNSKFDFSINLFLQTCLRFFGRFVLFLSNFRTKGKRPPVPGPEVEQLRLEIDQLKNLHKHVEKLTERVRANEAEMGVEYGSESQSEMNSARGSARGYALFLIWFCFRCQFYNISSFIWH